MRLPLAAILAAAPLAAVAQDPYPDAPPHATEGEPAYDVGIPATSDPKVFFLNLLDGETVESPVMIEFGMLGMRVMPAGEEVEGVSGHHHLLIDAELANPDEAIPADDNHLHFGDGATSATVELSPGEHTLQLVAGDMNHVPHDPPIMSERITVTVVE